MEGSRVQRWREVGIQVEGVQDIQGMEGEGEPLVDLPVPVGGTKREEHITMFTV